MPAPTQQTFTDTYRHLFFTQTLCYSSPSTTRYYLLTSPASYGIMVVSKLDIGLLSSNPRTNGQTCPDVLTEGDRYEDDPKYRDRRQDGEG